MAAIRVLAAALMLLLAAPGWAQDAGPRPSPEPGATDMGYGETALVTAAVVAGAVALNTLVAPNVGTILGALYVGHLVVEAALVMTGAGASWGLGWWDEAPAANAPAPLLK